MNAEFFNLDPDPPLVRSCNRDGNLAVAFEIHNIASTWEKRHEIKETHAGLASVKTFFLEMCFHEQTLGLYYLYIIRGNPVDISMYFASRRQHACKVPRPIGLRKFRKLSRKLSWHQMRIVSFRAVPAGPTP